MSSNASLPLNPPTISEGEKLVLALFFQPLELLFLTLKLGLVLVDLPLLLLLLLLLPLHLVADESPRPQAQRATDQGPCCGMLDCATDQAAGGRSTQGADSRAFLPCA